MRLDLLPRYSVQLLPSKQTNISSEFILQTEHRGIIECVTICIMYGILCSPNRFQLEKEIWVQQVLLHYCVQLVKDIHTSSKHLCC